MENPERIYSFPISPEIASRLGKGEVDIIAIPTSAASNGETAMFIVDRDATVTENQGVIGLIGRVAVFEAEPSPAEAKIILPKRESARQWLVRWIKAEDPPSPYVNINYLSTH